MRLPWCRPNLWTAISLNKTMFWIKILNKMFLTRFRPANTAMSFLEIAPVISVPEFIFSSLTYSLVRARFSQTSAGKQKILHLDTEGFTPFLFWPGPNFFLILALKSYKTENKCPFKILAQTVRGERIENLGQGSLTRINQNLSIIITKVALLILVSETLTLDCGTLIFENADKWHERNQRKI